MIKLTIRQMQYFEALIDMRHFGRAAALVGVTQPALSAQISEMEQRLGCRLFERGRTVEPTAEAELLRPRIGRILADVRELESTTLAARGAMAGRFRLGIIPTVAPFLLPRILPVLKRRYPALMLELREAVTPVLIEDTAAGRLDAMVAALPVSHPALASETLFDDRFFLAVADGDTAFDNPPIAPQSPELDRLLLLEEGHCLREQALAVCGSVRPAAMASYGATSLTTLLQMVSHGIGVTLVPELALDSGLPPGLRILPFAPPTPRRTLCLSRRRNGGQAADCAILAALIRDVGSAGGDEMDGEPDPEQTIGEEAQREGGLPVADTVRGDVDQRVDIA